MEPTLRLRRVRAGDGARWRGLRAVSPGGIDIYRSAVYKASVTITVPRVRQLTVTALTVAMAASAALTTAVPATAAPATAAPAAPTAARVHQAGRTLFLVTGEQLATSGSGVSVLGGGGGAAGQ